MKVFIKDSQPITKCLTIKREFDSWNREHEYYLRLTRWSVVDRVDRILRTPDLLRILDVPKDSLIDVDLADERIREPALVVVDATDLFQTSAILCAFVIIRLIRPRRGPFLVAGPFHRFTRDGDPVTFFEDIVDTHPDGVHSMFSHYA